MGFIFEMGKLEHTGPDYCEIGKTNYLIDKNCFFEIIAVIVMNYVICVFNLRVFGSYYSENYMKNSPK